MRWFQDKPLPRANDSISSLTAGSFLLFGQLIIGAFEVSTYVWVYENFRMYSLPWDSMVTWWLAMILVDFFYYWFHRMAHGIKVLIVIVCPFVINFLCYCLEVNLFWAAHQVHHSSQDYTLSTALRQSVMQRFSSWVSHVHVQSLSYFLILLFLCRYSIFQWRYLCLQLCT